MYFTLLGITIDCRSEQPLNAESPISVTSLGILSFLHSKSSFLFLVRIQLLIDVYLGLFCDTIIDEMLLQPEYLQPVITQYFASNKSEIWS